MIYQLGYVYHVKDEYFLKAQDDALMQNKEGGNYRPTYYALHDEETSLLWMVPMSAKYGKYKAILHIHARGRKIVFTDIDRLQKLMIEEIRVACIEQQ